LQLLRGKFIRIGVFSLIFDFSIELGCLNGDDWVFQGRKVVLALVFEEPDGLHPVVTVLLEGDPRQGQQAAKGHPVSILVVGDHETGVWVPVVFADFEVIEGS